MNSRNSGRQHPRGSRSGGPRRGGGPGNPNRGRRADAQSARPTGSDVDLSKLLRDIDNAGYGSYKRLGGGTFDLPLPDSDAVATLHIDRIQADPYAPPSRMRVSISTPTCAFPDALHHGPLNESAQAQVALSDFLIRRWTRSQKTHLPGGKGKSTGGLSIGGAGQQVLERTGISVTPDRIEARVDVSLPAAGRRVLGREAERLLCDTIPAIVAETFLYERFSGDQRRAVEEHVVTLQEQEYLRSQLAVRRLVGFVGDGSVLPRAAGDSDLPMTSATAEPFQSPESLRVSVELPTGRTVTGMGIPEGVTVIVGGGFHGKSTLLRAIERGVYPHIAGDGREWVITRSDAVSVRAEDGRPATGVNISPFIDNLPTGDDTRAFTTTNASGSTSQATNLVEATEAGATALLIDEDTSATNFMIRDDRMRRLIPSDREPITPFVDRVRPLYESRGVSTVLVAGGSGAFFGVADHVIALDTYVPVDVTDKAHSLYDASLSPTSHTETPDQNRNSVSFDSAPRIPDAKSLRLTGKFRSAKVRGARAIQYGDTTIDMGLVAQLVDSEQTSALGLAMDRIADIAAESDSESGLSTVDLVAELFSRISESGLDVLSPSSGHPGHLARPRPQEVHAVLNRYRNLRLR